MNSKIWDAICDVLFVVILLLILRVGFILYGGDW